MNDTLQVGIALVICIFVIKELLAVIKAMKSDKPDEDRRKGETDYRERMITLHEQQTNIMNNTLGIVKDVHATTKEVKEDTTIIKTQNENRRAG